MLTPGDQAPCCCSQDMTDTDKGMSIMAYLNETRLKLYCIRVCSKLWSIRR